MSTISAGQIVTGGEKRALQAALGATVPVSGTSPYLALLTNAASGSLDNTWTTMAQVTEYMGGPANGYARQAFTIGTPSSASPSVISNSNTITFGPTSSSPGTTIYWGMMTDASSGTTANLLVAYLLGTARTPVSGDSLQGAAAAFTCQV